MKKIIVLILSVLVLGLVGCTSKKDENEKIIPNEENIVANNAVKDNNEEKGEESGDNIHQEKELTEEELVEKYKISDEYVLGWFDYNVSSYNILGYNEYDNSYPRERIYNDQDVLSDGMNFRIECDMISKYYEGVGRAQDAYEITINGEKIELGYWAMVGVIDLDPADEYKEIIIEQGEGMDSFYSIHRLTKDGLVRLYEGSSFDDGGLRLINGNYISPSYDIQPGIVFGYDVYEDGEFKTIHRFLTGEKITDENGNFTEGFTNQVFDVPAEGYSIVVFYNGNTGGIFGKVKFLKRTYVEGRYIYDVELADDCRVETKDENIILPKGTILRYNQ